VIPDGKQTLPLEFKVSTVKIGPRERLASKVGVRKTHYREDKACNMLHLSDKKRLDVGKSCLKYFMYIYKIIIRNESRT